MCDSDSVQMVMSVPVTPCGQSARTVPAVASAPASASLGSWPP